MVWRAALLVGMGCGAAAAQTPPPTAREGVVVYQTDFFTPFAPQTALDMVRRVPGFVISEGEERRGFAAAAGNVLIDGVPPAAKSEDLDDILDRIPARDVVRIELIRGEGASASSAQAIRLNVVRTPGDGEGVWTLSAEHAQDGRVSPAVQASWTGRRGAVEYGVSAFYEDAHTPISGDVRSVDAFGAADESDIEWIRENDRERRLTGELTTPFAGGGLMLNAALGFEEGREREITRTFDALGLFDAAEDANARERDSVAEIGATFTRTWGAWDAELAALATRRTLADDETALETTSAGTFDEAEREARDVDTGETIVRAAATRSLSGGASFATGAEAAFNTLDQRLELTEDDGAGPVPVDVPAANVGIEEWRAEAFATYAWRPAPLWRLEASGAVEMSRLTQSGDAALTTELTYWKPSLQAVRRIGEDDQLRFRIYRDVGQLNFEDFAASAELTGSSVFAGNADLRPETSWRAEAAGDWRFEHGALGVTLFYWQIEDALDYIIIGDPGDEFDARGNIGEATLSGARVTFEAPLPFLRDARLRGEGLFQESEVTDPLTGAARPQSEIVESTIVLEFRQDVPALGFSWGVDFERERVAPEFRFDRVTQEDEADELELWLETTRISGVKLRVFAANLANARDVRDRTFYAPDRAGSLDGTEHRVRRYGDVFGVSVQGSF